MAYTLPQLPYAYDALEPHIDARTMEIHHTKHHQTYVDNANKALEGTEWADLPVEELIQKLDQLPADKKGALRNNAGGHANHSLFWQVMGQGKGGQPSGELMDAWFSLRPRPGGPQVDARAVLFLWSFPMLMAPPILSHDSYAYAAEGYMIHSGLNRYAANEIEQASRRKKPNRVKPLTAIERFSNQRSRRLGWNGWRLVSPRWPGHIRSMAPAFHFTCWASSERRVVMPPTRARAVALILVR